MAETTRASATDRIFDSIVERQATFFDAVRAAGDRYHRFNRSLIEGSRQGARDWAEVGRRWADAPADVVGLYEAVSEAVGNAQARVLALSREWLEDRVEAQRETRDVIRQSFGDVREAAERFQASAPEFLRRASSTLRRGANGAAETAAAEA